MVPLALDLLVELLGGGVTEVADVDSVALDLLSVEVEHAHVVDHVGVLLEETLLLLAQVGVGDVVVHFEQGGSEDLVLVAEAFAVLDAFLELGEVVAGALDDNVLQLVLVVEVGVHELVNVVVKGEQLPVDAGLDLHEVRDFVGHVEDLAAVLDEPEGLPNCFLHQVVPEDDQPLVEEGGLVLVDVLEHSDGPLQVGLELVDGLCLEELLDLHFGVPVGHLLVHVKIVVEFLLLVLYMHDWDLVAVLVLECGETVLHEFKLLGVEETVDGLEALRELGDVVELTENS